MVKTAEIKEEIKIPDGVQITVEGKTVHVKGQKGAMSKLLSHPR
jgi:ribosomal protein L6P/L9E